MATNRKYTPHEDNAPTLLDAALGYARHGIPVFPLHSTDGHGNCTCSKKVCSNPGKHPHTDNGLLDATTNEFQVRQWWTRWPEANIGLRTGKRFVVLDADDGDAGLVEAQEYGIDVGQVHSRTGNGRHFPLQVPDGVVLRNKVKDTGDWPLLHCDARAEGGYIVAPPSRHSSGRRYGWSAVLDLDHLPVLPEKLLAVWVDSPDDPRNSDPYANEDEPDGAPGNEEAHAGDAQGEVTATYYVRKYTARILAHATAGRNDTGVLLGCQLRDNGISLDGAVPYLRQYQHAVEHARPGKAPYTWDEAEHTLKSVYSRPARKAAHPQLTAPGALLWSVQWYVRQFGARLRYAPAFGTWYESNGKWWEPAEEDVATRYGKDAVLQLYQQAALERDDDKRKELRDLAYKLDKPDKVAAMVTHASDQKPISVTKDQLDPDDYKVVAANGVIDLRTGRLLDHEPHILHTRHLGPTLAGLVYDPAAECPNWLAFLRTIFQGDDELVAFIKRAGGSTLTGDISEQAWFPCFGEGENGKSTMTQAFQDVLGTYADTLPSNSLLATPYERHPADLAKLVGVRGVFASETEKGRYLASNLIKQLTGGEKVDARFMRANWFNFKPKLKLWLHTNDKPRIRDDTHAMWRRIYPIPFRYRIPQVDKHFYERVLAPELPGILAWMVAGCVEWQRDGLGLPSAVEKERAEYKEESNVLDEFISDHLWREPSAWAWSGEVYKAYCAWCRARGETIGSQMALTQAIERTFNVVVSKDGKGRRRFLRLALRGQAVDDE